MGKQKKGRQERRIRVVGIQREQRDMKKLGRALIELAQAQAEAEALADRQAAARRVAEGAAERARREQA